MILTDDDTTSDDNETQDNAYRHGDDEIKVISLVMFWCVMMVHIKNGKGKHVEN
jgi:hypothetical protein